jgi:hypothetical protein
MQHQPMPGSKSLQTRFAEGVPMRWEDSLPRPGINFGALFGVPASSTLFQVYILRVPAGNPLPVALVEFWRRVLTDGPPQCNSDWDSLVLESWPEAGGFTTAFTRSDLCNDQPPVFKLRSTEMERRWYDLPDDDDAAAGVYALEQEWVELLTQAAHSDLIAGLLAKLRSVHQARVWLTNQTRSERRVLDL